MQPLFLDIARVLQTHRSLIERYGGQEGVRDVGLLHSAIAMPQALLRGQLPPHGSVRDGCGVPLPRPGRTPGPGARGGPWSVIFPAMIWSTRPGAIFARLATARTFLADTLASLATAARVSCLPVPFCLSDT